MVNVPPRRLKAGPYSFDIFTDARNFNRIINSQSDGVVADGVRGITDLDMNAVAINPSPMVGESTRRETVFHEVMHIAWYVAGLAHEFPDDVEEMIVRRLSTTQLSILRDNPKLVEYVSGTER